ncbi:MAG TPA: isochorismatase family cysteine hydrolase [Dehalococcoidia bacterium]|nr:isochorismatase family cysteine hydrolase [Dehalococcoidia bacterium]
MNLHTEPHADSGALLTIDVQRDFALPGAPLEIPGTMDTVPRIGRLLKAFRAAGRPIVHVVRLYQEDGSNVDPVRRAAVEGGARMAAPGSDGAELLDELKPDPALRLDAEALLRGQFQRLAQNEFVMYKPRWGAFYGTALEAFLRERSIDTIVLAGCNFPNCPRTTIYEASERDFRIVAVVDAISGAYDRGIQELRNIGVLALTTDQCLAWFAGEAPQVTSTRTL